MIPLPDHPAPSTRPTFRRRLLMTLGPALALALVVLGALAVLFAYGWMTYSAQTVLDAEITEVASQIITPQGTLAPDAYHWHEPHHLFDERHIDPYFLQIFDAHGHLLRLSDNIREFPAGTYPNRLLAYQTSDDWLIQRLRTFTTNGQLLYYRTRPLRNPAGTLLGYIQAARYEPGVTALLGRITVYLILGLAPVLAGLLGLIWWGARRVVQPLEQITREARAISPTRLGQRITMPPQADQETAHLAATLNRQLDLLEQAFDDMRRFTTNAAHELQTPLAVLRGHVEVALRRDRPPGAYRETLTVLHTEINGLIRMVRSLLHLARLDQIDQSLLKEPLDLVPLVRNEAAYFEQQATARGVSFNLYLPHQAWIQAQPDQMREIIANLLDNAVKYTRKGEIVVRVESHEATVHLTVEDTGIGMPPDVLRHVTDRFYRAPTVDAEGIPGSGLGLSLVQQIVAQHHGHLDITSEPGQGTRVHITF